MTPLKNFVTDIPYQNFVAIYADGSGAAIFHYDKRLHVIRDNEGDILETPFSTATYLFDAGYLWWLPLPDDFVFWFQHKAEEEAA